MVIVGNMQLFPDHLTGGTPLGLPLSWGDQKWCLYIQALDEQILSQSIWVQLSSDHMDLCTILVTLGTDRALSDC